MRSIQRITAAIGMCGTLLVASGCESLNVTNPNEPDAERVLSDGPGVLAVAGGTYRTWFSTTASMEAAGVLVTQADSYSASWNNFSMRFYSSEPRDGWENNPTASSRVVVEWYWYGFYSALSSANDVLTAIRRDSIEVNSPEDTKMVETAALLMQGMTLGDLALIYDQAFIVDETSDVTALSFSPRAEVQEAALAKLDEAISVANANSFDFPSNWFNGNEYDNVQVAQIANTVAARLLAYFPRTSGENSAVDWARVVSYASQGISSGAGFDLIFTGDGNCPDLTGGRGFCDELKLWSNDITTMRMDTRVANLLDPTTQAHPWPDPNGNPRPNSLDRRLGNGTNGTDFRWDGAAIFRPARGQYHQSNIGHIRYEKASFNDPTGTPGLDPVPVMSRAENDLLWAEGLIRSGGSLVQAATLINNTRVTRGGLPPATAADGVAGLLTKLQYEQDVELPGLGAAPFFNRRRIDGLQPLTPRHMPVPARELGVLQLELYTFGGPGNPDLDRSGYSNVPNVHEVFAEMSRSNNRIGKRRTQ